MSANVPHPEFWEKWLRHLETSDDAARLISLANDEDLVALLSTPSVNESQIDRDTIAAELMRRLARRETDLPSGALDVLRSARAAYSAAIRAQRPMSAAQAILHAEGARDIGRSVSASATSSLATTKVAYEAAQEHAKDVQTTMAQTRVSETLAGDAAETATRGSDATRDLETLLKEGGHAKEGREADEAARDVATTAQTAKALARKNRFVEEGRVSEAEEPR